MDLKRIRTSSIFGTMIGVTPGVITGLSIGELFACSYAVFFWFAGLVFIPVTGIMIAHAVRRWKKDISLNFVLLYSIVGGFVIGILMSYNGIPVGC